MRGGKTGCFFELIGKVSDTAVFQLKRYFRQRHFFIYQQFFDSFNPLFDKKVLNGAPFYRRKETTEVGIFMMQML